MNNTTTKAAETAKKAGTTRNTGVRTMVQIGHAGGRSYCFDALGGAASVYCTEFL